MKGRLAIYFAPADDSPLDEFGRVMLQRSATQPGMVNVLRATDSTVGDDGQAEEISAMLAAIRGDLDQDQWQYLTGKPRHYGFHATLKAPFELAEGYQIEDLVTELARFSESRPAVPLFGLAPLVYDNFLSLAMTGTIAEVDQLAGEVVEYFEPFRAPLSAFDHERRNPARLSARQIGYLQRYGYPYVLDDFRFHMTLTSRQAPESLPSVQHVASLYERLIPNTPVLDRLALFHQPTRSHPFTRIAESSLAQAGSGTGQLATA